MATMKPKLGSIQRQQSLQQSDPVVRQVLKKQISFDETSIKQTNFKVQKREHRNNIQVVATKYNELTTTYASTKPKPIIFSKPNVASRMKHAWQERAANSKSIDIFLARSLTVSDDDLDHNENVVAEKPQKISLLLQPIPSENTSAGAKRDMFRRNSKTINVTTTESPRVPEHVVRSPMTRSQTLPNSETISVVPIIKRVEKKHRSKTARPHRNNDNKNKMVRCKSATSAAEVVTMVSLTSPPLSDAEEDAQCQANLAKIRKENLIKKAEINAKLEAQRLLTLKKIVKQGKQLNLRKQLLFNAQTFSK